VLSDKRDRCFAALSKTIAISNTIYVGYNTACHAERSEASIAMGAMRNSATVVSDQAMLSNKNQLKSQNMYHFKVSNTCGEDA
jgi:hypothetical protein